MEKRQSQRHRKSNKCRHKVTEILITKESINRVDFLAEQDDIKPDLIFKTRSGEILNDDVLIAGVDDDDSNTATTQDTDSDTGSDYEQGDDSKSAGVEDDENIGEIGEEELYELQNDAEGHA